MATSDERIKRSHSAFPPVTRVPYNWESSPEIPQDTQLGYHLAEVIGELHLEGIPAHQQWAMVCRALRIHGLRIAEERRKNLGSFV